ncbi:carboxymuconolactone decarboxylase family protein [Neobacillus terrae]|uniref:carboxymuconolactone decarboxylase family protein n=1 Tax=Neobacillus terrae TaxID=3034837 RepID=UPI00140CFDB1|nr:carboxymuconolactone decarboxylase family protein [Neobacillus terrae]NHM32893.1 carboxymuconolactone decarboxylase family protein [Neobacillus terrae]
MAEFNGLEYFEKVYGQVPEWASKMHQFSPTALDHYTALRNEILVKGKMKQKDKELILVGVNAARRYERSMLYHTKGAIDAGATVEEIIEIISTCIISRGIPAWMTGIKAISYALNDLKGQYSIEPVHEEKGFTSVEECLNFFRDGSGAVPEWLNLLGKHNPDVLIQYCSLRKIVLKEQAVSRKLKELLLVGINVCERYKEGVALHVKGARNFGATDEEIAEISLVGLLTAGIPAWFEGSDFL